MNKLQIVKNARAIAAETLNTVLRDVIENKKKISEVEFRDKWLKELRKHKSIFPDGWYMPPPHGIGVLFGNTKRNSRCNYKTLRPKDMWPRDDIFLDLKKGMAYLFASPVDKKTGIIGDFGLTIYLGKNSEIKNHLRKCIQIDKKIFNYIHAGLTFKKGYDYAEKTITEAGLKNNIESTTDPAGRDYGHTLPATYFNWNDSELMKLKHATRNWGSVADMISKKRIFVNAIEKMPYTIGMAITLEPRITNSSNSAIPMGSFHTIILLHNNGKKELLTQFDEIFKTVGMDYMLNG